MKGPADRSVRLLLMIAGAFLSYDIARLCRCSGIETPLVDDLAVHVNLDPLERLRLLPGIGPVIAAQVVEERNIEPFLNSEDFVRRIRGIGPAFVANFGNWLRFDQKLDSIVLQPGNVTAQERLP